MADDRNEERSEGGDSGHAVDRPRGLLAFALQDLHAGERTLVERLPKVGGDTDDERLGRFAREDRARSEGQADALVELAEALGVDPNGGPNVWMNAVLDDAANDADTIESGPWRDVALVGALRKAKQSERVSYETALALAERLKLDDAAGALARIRDAEQAADEELAALLWSLCDTNGAG